MRNFYQRIVLLILFVLTINYSYSQLLQFAQRAGSDSEGMKGEEGNCIALDNDGNIYITGTILAGSSGAIFGEGQDNEKTLSINGAFVAKYNNLGELIWVDQIGNPPNGATGHALEIDMENNVYVSGTFYENAIFGLGQSNETTLTGVLGEIFIAKYDSDGKLIWAKSTGGERDENPGGKALALDNTGNIFLTGTFNGEVTFGKGEQNDTTLIGKESDIFIAKYNNNGELIWVRQAGGTSDDGAYNVVIDEDGNSFITGTYYTNAIFGQGLSNETNFTHPNVSSFIAKYNNNGEFLWAKEPFKNSRFDICGDIARDNEGNIVYTGAFVGTITLGEGTINEMQLSNPGNEDQIIISKYTSDGDFIWAKTALGGGGRGTAIATDTLSNIFVTGYYQDDIQFGKEERNDTTITNAGLSDIYLAKFSKDGEFIWVTSAGGADWEEGSDITVDRSGNSYITGFYRSNLDFGKGEVNETMLSIIGYNDIYFSKFQHSFNEAPKFSYEDSLILDENFSDTYILNTTPGIVRTGEENQNITYSIQPELSEIMDITFDKTTGSLSISSIPNKFGKQTFIITADDGEKENYSFSQELAIIINPVLGIEKDFLNNFSIYPNPFSNEFKINANNSFLGSKELKIYSLDGTLILKKKISSIDTEGLIINFNSMPKGLYILEIGSIDMVRIMKIYKN